MSTTILPAAPGAVHGSSAHHPSTRHRAVRVLDQDHVAEAAQRSTVLVADDILGPYAIVQTDLKPLGMNAGDFDLVVDPTDGKAYYYFERVHSELICADLTDDYTDVTGYYSTHFPLAASAVRARGAGLLPPRRAALPVHLGHDRVLPEPVGGRDRPTLSRPVDGARRPASRRSDRARRSSRRSARSSSTRTSRTCTSRWPIGGCRATPSPARRRSTCTPTDFRPEGGRPRRRLVRAHARSTRRSPTTSGCRSASTARRAFLDWHDEWRIEDYA